MLARPETVTYKVLPSGENVRPLGCRSPGQATWALPEASRRHNLPVRCILRHQSRRCCSRRPRMSPSTAYP